VAAWPIMPFAVAFWAFIRPNRAKRHLVVIAVANGLLAAAFAANGALLQVGYTVLSGAVSALFVAWVARARLHDFLLEAQRNVALEQVHAGNLASERASVLAWLQESVGNELGRIARTANVDPRAAAQAASLQNDLFAITHRPDEGPVRLDALARRIDLKARALCPEGGLFVRRTGEDAPLPGEDANALLRIAQEFVRNAVTHANATQIEVELATTPRTVELRVSNNGKPFVSARRDAAFVTGSGGLANAQRWLTEARGSLVVADPKAPYITALHAVVPRRGPTRSSRDRC
jgi:signal transduction histidine kinase